MLIIKRKKKGKKNYATRMGFEPTRAEHNGLAVHRLNHSATSSVKVERVKYIIKYRSILRTGKEVLYNLSLLLIEGNLVQ